MQRWGGGSYTRKRKGGGNDPRCGCDMRVGWETSFGNVKQQGGGCGCGAGLLMNGGGSCGSGVIMERVLQGGSRKGRRGLLFANGGGYDYSKDMIIDYFPKMNMTELVYNGKGGKKQDIGRTLGNMRADVSSISNYASQPQGTQAGGKRQDIGRTLSNTRADVSSISNYASQQQRGGKRQNIGRTLGNMRADVSSISNYASQPQGTQTGGTCPVPDACPFPGTGYCEFYAKGGANYGEPMSLQAKLRGGGDINGCGCLKNPFIRGYTGNSLTGGKYKITRKNRNALKRHKAGKSIGFTMRSHLKAIGLLPRTSKKNYGKKIVSNKYK